MKHYTRFGAVALIEKYNMKRKRRSCHLRFFMAKDAILFLPAKLEQLAKVVTGGNLENAVLVGVLFYI